MNRESDAQRIRNRETDSKKMEKTSQALGRALVGKKKCDRSQTRLTKKGGHLYSKNSSVSRQAPKGVRVDLDSRKKQVATEAPG